MERETEKIILVPFPYMERGTEKIILRPVSLKVGNRKKIF